MSWSEPRWQALRLVADLWRRGEVMVIGAAALEALQEFRRTTRDIDLVVVASPEQIEAKLQAAGWKRDPQVPHRWSTPAGEPVDVIPASAELLDAGRLVWPNGNVMNLAGIKLALRTAENVALGDDKGIDVASLTVQPLLKIAAYMDRPSERQKDIGDLVELLRDGLAPRESDWEEAAAAGLDEALACAYTVGRRLGTLTESADSALLEAFMEKARDPADRHRTREVIARCGRWIVEDNDHEDVMPLFEAFAAGLECSRGEKGGREPGP